MNKFGFTGTRDRMSKAQEWATGGYLSDHHGEFHHGCCVGADATAFWLAKQREYRCIAHPPTNGLLVNIDTIKGSWCVRRELPYLERNRAIVIECDILLAAPKGPEELRSGTWATVRYARKILKPVIVFWPNGEIEIVAKRNRAAG